jgi:hypothetical protein
MRSVATPTVPLLAIVGRDLPGAMFQDAVKVSWLCLCAEVGIVTFLPGITINVVACSDLSAYSVHLTFNRKLKFKLKFCDMLSGCVLIGFKWLNYLAFVY